MNIFYLLHPKNTVDFLYDDDTMLDGLNKIRECGYTALPVIDREGNYTGTVSEGDFLRFMTDNCLFAAETQEDYVISDLIRKGWNPPIKVTASMAEVFVQVMDQNFLPVVDDRGCFAGIITRKDIFKYFYDKYKPAEQAADPSANNDGEKP